MLGIATGLVGLHYHHQPSEQVQAAQVVVAMPEPVVVATPGWPVRLQIPKINVDAALDYVGITARGALDTPKGPANAGWYDRGPRPGEAGNAIIDGHFGWVHKTPAVFDNLHLLEKGDVISTIDDRGVAINFVVRDMQTYTENQADAAIFAAADNAAHLNLITCDGTWNAAQKSYSNRLVVFADRQNASP